VKLQLQLTRSRATWQFKGPVDCLRQVLKAQGPVGLYRGISSMLLFRSCFSSMFCSYEVLLRSFRSLRGGRFEVSPSTATFLSGGLSAFAYWAIALPFDNMKNRILADDIYHPKYSAMPWPMAKRIYSEGGILNFYRGFGPILLRAFPVNACAFFVFESLLVLLNAEKTSQ